MKTTKKGIIRYTKDDSGQFHSYNDEPAIEYVDGSKEWYKHGKFHRDNGYATINKYKTKKYYRDGLLHRDGGPAIKMESGTQYWYKNGLLHREDGAASCYGSGDDINNHMSEYWYNDTYICDEEYCYHNAVKKPRTEEEKVILINQPKLVKYKNSYCFVNYWLKQDKKFYEKYKILFEEI